VPVPQALRALLAELRARYRRPRNPLRRGFSSLAPAFADTRGRAVDEDGGGAGERSKPSPRVVLHRSPGVDSSRVLVKAGSGHRVHQVVVSPVPDRAEAPSLGGCRRGGRRPRPPSVIEAQRRDRRSACELTGGLVIEPTRDPEREKRDRGQQQTTLSRAAAPSRVPRLTAPRPPEAADRALRQVPGIGVAATRRGDVLAEAVDRLHRRRGEAVAGHLHLELIDEWGRAQPLPVRRRSVARPALMGPERADVRVPVDVVRACGKTVRRARSEDRPWTPSWSDRPASAPWGC
jgi:hypothetical protein